jgi:hypothetical protein
MHSQTMPALHPLIQLAQLASITGNEDHTKANQNVQLQWEFPNAQSSTVFCTSVTEFKASRRPGPFLLSVKRLATGGDSSYREKSHLFLLISLEHLSDHAAQKGSQKRKEGGRRRCVLVCCPLVRDMRSRS